VDRAKERGMRERNLGTWLLAASKPVPIYPGAGMSASTSVFAGARATPVRSDDGPLDREEATRSTATGSFFITRRTGRIGHVDVVVISQ
jgi:hypothetical protein